MFTLRDDETFDWPVKPKVPVNGKYETLKLTATFNVLSSDDINTMLDTDDGGSIKALLNRALVSFKAEFPVQDSSGAEITDDEERNALLLSKPYMIQATMDAFQSGLTGFKAKN